MGNRVPSPSAATPTASLRRPGRQRFEHAQSANRVAGGNIRCRGSGMGMIRFDNGALLQIEFSWAPMSRPKRALSSSAARGPGLAWRDGQVEIFTESMASSSTCARPGRWPTMAMPQHPQFIDALLGKPNPATAAAGGGHDPHPDRHLRIGPHRRRGAALIGRALL